MRVPESVNNEIDIIQRTIRWVYNILDTYHIPDNFDQPLNVIMFWCLFVKCKGLKLFSNLVTFYKNLAGMALEWSIWHHGEKTQKYL